MDLDGKRRVAVAILVSRSPGDREGHDDGSALMAGLGAVDAVGVTVGNGDGAAHPVTAKARTKVPIGAPLTRRPT